MTPSERYLRQLSRALPALPLRRRRIVREIAHHLASAAAAQTAAGRTGDEAERLAIELLGPPELVAVGFTADLTDRTIAFASRAVTVVLAIRLLGAYLWWTLVDPQVAATLSHSIRFTVADAGAATAAVALLAAAVGARRRARIGLSLLVAVSVVVFMLQAAGWWPLDRTFAEAQAIAGLVAAAVLLLLRCRATPSARIPAVARWLYVATAGVTISTASTLASQSFGRIAVSGEYPAVTVTDALIYVVPVLVVLCGAVRVVLATVRRPA